MIDEIYDRQYQQGRQALHSGIDRLVTVIGHELGKSLDAVHRFEWSAPWAPRSAPRPARSNEVGCG